MGNASSTTTDEVEEDLDPFDGADTLGYRVLGVQPNSPASKAGLVSFLDFLVGADNRMLLGSGTDLEPGQEYDDVDLPAFLEENKGKEVEFLVWNIKSQQARLVLLTPNDDWGGAGLLGVTIRMDNYAGAEDRLVRVLTVEPQSPAAVAGLVAHKDFILGTTHQTLDSTSTLARVLQAHQDQVVELYVYNVDSDMVRVVALMPTLSWGGRGLLGAEVGTGYLHRLPAATRATEGTSVERKVRYVGVAPGSNNYKNNNSSSSSNNNNTTTGSDPASGSGPKGGGNSADPIEPILELEPQLEMEAEESEDERQHQSQQQQAQQRQDGTDDRMVKLAAGSDSKDVHGLEQQQERQQQQQQPETRPLPQAPANAAGSVFSVGLPPPPLPPHSSSTTTKEADNSGSTNISYRSAAPTNSVVPAFLPPPPKMHYESPPRLAST